MDIERCHDALGFLCDRKVIHRFTDGQVPFSPSSYLWNVAESPLPQFLRPEDVSEILNVPVGEIHELLTSGELLGIRVGARAQWRIDVEQLQLFIADAYEFEARAARWRQAEHATIIEVADGRIL